MKPAFSYIITLLARSNYSFRSRTYSFAPFEVPLRNLHTNSDNSVMSVTDLVKPSWTGNYDTPHYKVLEKTEDYELREYEDTKWALSELPTEGSKWESRKERSPTFWKLFKYITGANEPARKIPMTTPVRMEHSDDRVDMAFMVPHHEYDDTPPPTSADVKVVTQPKQRVYVRTFGGFARGFFGNQNYFIPNIEELKASLDRAGKTYDSEKFYTAQYDSPFALFNRHNEVWIPAA